MCCACAGTCNHVGNHSYTTTTGAHTVMAWWPETPGQLRRAWSEGRPGVTVGTRRLSRRQRSILRRALRRFRRER